LPQFYIIPKQFARKAPALVRAAQWIEGVAFRFIFWVMRKLPLETALRVAGFAFELTGRFSDKADKARANLAVAFPDSTEEWRERTTRKIFRSLGYSAAELIKLQDIWDEREERVEYVIDPVAREYLEQKRPTVYVTAHVGPWQVAPFVTRHFGVEINTIYAPESNPVLADLMLELRQFLGEKLISTEDGPRPLLKALSAGESINTAMDTRPDAGKLIPFFGRDALANTSVAGMALRTGAGLITARGERLPGGRYRITVYRPVISPDPEAPAKEQAVMMTEAVYRQFEDWIREYPEQWICLKRRWPKAHRL
jgi:KDO2-lipid IV(A) lauroyltransferase